MDYNTKKPSDKTALEYYNSFHVTNEDNRYMNDWWNEYNAQSVNVVPTKDTMIYSDDLILAYNNKSSQHSRASSGTSNGSTLDDYYGSNVAVTSGGTSTMEALKQYGTCEEESPLQWNVGQVVSWLESVGLESVTDMFIDQEITGDVLLNLDQNSLKELGVNTYGCRFKVLNAIDRLRSGTSFYQDLYMNDMKDNSTLHHVPSTLPKRVKYENALYRDYHSSLPLDRSNIMSPSKRSISDPIVSRKNTTVSEDHLTLQPSSSMPLPLLNSIESQQQIDYPDHQGWVYKQSNRYKTWNKRWFVLYGTNLFYFKHPTDSLVKGIIHLQGYRVILESSVNSIKRYHFKLHHDKERSFFFHTKTRDDMKLWVQALSKATIIRNNDVPTVSSSNIYTVPLDIAQQMKLRPPSTLMYSNKKCNADVQFYQEVMEHCEMSEEELNETLLWMEHPIKQKPSPQKSIARPYKSNVYNQQELLYNSQKQKLQKKSDDNPLQNKQIVGTSSNNTSTSALLHWVNGCISPAAPALDLSQSMRSGEVLVQILEAVTGKTIPRCQNQVSKSMIMLDTIVEAFKFMHQEGFVNTECTIKDVYCGDEERIVDLLLDLKAWVEENQKAHP